MLHFIENQRKGREERKKGGNSRDFLLLPLLLLCSLVLSACKGVEITGKTENVNGYPEQQAMLVIGCERNRYQALFSDKIWDLPVEGETEKEYGSYFIAKEKEFLQNIMTLNMMAKEKGITVNSVELEVLRSAAKIFYDGMSEQDKEYFHKPTVGDILVMYEAYYTAEKMGESLLSAVNEEIADADAKVIEVQRIVISDRAKAERVHEAAIREGADFSQIARQNTEDPDIDITIARDLAKDAVQQAAFQLRRGEVSDVLQQDGKFYILKSVDDYDAAKTKERKTRLERAMKTEAFQEGFGAYQSQHIIRFREEFWKQISVRDGEGSTKDDFFLIYQDAVEKLEEK